MSDPRAFDGLVSVLGPILAMPEVRVLLVFAALTSFVAALVEYLSDRSYRHAVRDHNAAVLSRREAAAAARAAGVGRLAESSRLAHGTVRRG